MERRVRPAGKRGISTFFTVADNKGVGIREVVEWGKTSRGGKQIRTAPSAGRGVDLRLPVRIARVNLDEDDLENLVIAVEQLASRFGRGLRS
jgi:hypothetical protein